MADEKKKQVSHAQNIITPTEFEELEKKEGRKIKLKGSPDEPPKPPPKPAAMRSSATDTDMLLLKTEKLEGKIEAVSDFRKALDERMSGISEEIGELRSSLMSKDRDIREVQQGFTKIKEAAEALEPKKIADQFAKKEEAIEMNQALTEALQEQMKLMRNDIKANTDVLKNIRDIKNLTDILTKLKENMMRMEEDRKFTQRAAAKIESMFSDLGDKLGEFQGYKDKIKFNDETMHEIMKTMDALETKFDASARKDDLSKLQDATNENMEKLGTGLDDKVFGIKKVLDDLLNSLREGGLKGILQSVSKTKLDSVFATKGEIAEIKAKLGMLSEASMRTAAEKQAEFSGQRQIPAAPARAAPAREEPSVKIFGGSQQLRTGTVQKIQDRIESIIAQAHESIKSGEINIAKNLYLEAYSLYNQFKQAESYNETVAIYANIKKLYARLRLYS